MADWGIPGESKSMFPPDDDLGQQVELKEEYDPDYEPTEEDLVEYCGVLGMDPVADRDLMWLAREGLKAPLPVGWKPVKDITSDEVYYFNYESGESIWEHPQDQRYREMYKAEKAKLQAKRRGGQEGRPKTSAGGRPKTAAAVGRAERAKPADPPGDSQEEEEESSASGAGAKWLKKGGKKSLAPLRSSTSPLDLGGVTGGPVMGVSDLAGDLAGGSDDDRSSSSDGGAALREDITLGGRSGLKGPSWGARKHGSSPESDSADDLQPLRREAKGAAAAAVAAGQEVADQNRQELERLRAEHRRELDDAAARHRQALARQAEDESAALARAREAHLAAVARLDRENADALERRAREHRDAVARHTKEGDAELAQLARQAVERKAELAQLEAEHKAAVAGKRSEIEAAKESKQELDRRMADVEREVAASRAELEAKDAAARQAAQAEREREAAALTAKHRERLAALRSEHVRKQDGLEAELRKAGADARAAVQAEEEARTRELQEEVAQIRDACDTERAELEAERASIRTQREAADAELKECQAAAEAARKDAAAAAAELRTANAALAEARAACTSAAAEEARAVAAVQQQDAKLAAGAAALDAQATPGDGGEPDEPKPPEATGQMRIDDLAQGDGDGDALPPYLSRARAFLKRNREPAPPDDPETAALMAEVDAILAQDGHPPRPAELDELLLEDVVADELTLGRWARSHRRAAALVDSQVQWVDSFRQSLRLRQQRQAALPRAGAHLATTRAAIRQRILKERGGAVRAPALQLSLDRWGRIVPTV